MLCHPELHPAVTYALRNVKSHLRHRQYMEICRLKKLWF